MKISKNEIRLSGLSTVYEPDDLSETGLEYVPPPRLGPHNLTSPRPSDP